MEMKENVASKEPNGDVVNLMWIKAEPVEADIRSQLLGDSGPVEGPIRIKLEPEFIIDEGRVGQYFCFYCHQVFKSLFKLKKHIKKNHFKLYRSLSCDEQIFIPFSPTHSGLAREDKDRESHSLFSGYHEIIKSSKTQKLQNSAIKRDIFALSKEKQYSCPECNYRTGERWNLKRHIITKHTNYRPFCCPQCDYKTADSGSLTTHVRYIHTNEKPFMCPHCQFKSTQSHTLKIHIMGKHTKEKPNSCPYCEYRSTHKGTLKNHITAKHTNERPYSCPHCEYRAPRSAALKRHMTIHTKEKPFSCPECDYEAAQKGNLKNHIKTKHTNQNPFTSTGD